MSKKIKRIALIVLLIAISSFALYKKFEPKTAPKITPATFNMLEATETTLKDFEKRDNGTYYVWLMADDLESQYVLEHIISPLAAELKQNPFPTLEVIKLPDPSISSSMLKKQWSINGFPAFISITVANKNASVTSKLEWLSAAPYDQNDLKKWLADNNLWPEVVIFRED